ncbi:ABC transporter permease [Pseudochelatococcus contaminans]|uniref:Branched-chain amino acid transport system permease protein n=1 Tax=Pseudochelatococcus contaminans TaxID=1538103 RepID=A0A7W5Z3B1_9HYPH|nr:ABC transporter permease [Pseudochelatococcus contaminans]MBB3809366.1 branched-chain amino acid transport system permease protein [Pseudochelatococcus contaminans]
MEFLLVQALTGLASAASLFLVASGLSIIFGVTRVVNFAHGSFYMVGAYLAYTLTERLAGPLGFWGGVLLAALLVGVLGALVELLLLRRLARAPELFQLLATFGVTLIVQDLVVAIWGPEDLVGRRAPGLTGAVEILGQFVPAYDLFLIALGPLVLLLLHLLFRRTRFGVLVRAATQDRDMTAALGVDQKWLFTGVFALGSFLAGLGGALQLPRDAVSHLMDMHIIVEAFVVVVIGGLGSVPGAFVAAAIVSLLNAFGILVFPGIAMVSVFLVMALVLVARPHGLFGSPPESQPQPMAVSGAPWRAFDGRERALVAFGVLLAAGLPFLVGDYGLTVASEILIMMLFAASIHLLMSAGGLAPFGHAVFFGLGGYGAALAVKLAGASMPLALVAGPVVAIMAACVFGWFCVRLSGVYFAMLTLAFAQIVWAVAFQWVAVTGGDNGIIGIWPEGFAASASGFYWMALVLCLGGAFALRTIVLSPFGYALRAVRDARQRAESIGIGRFGQQWFAFVIAGGFAGLAGALFAYLKGSVFPANMGVGMSVDGLVMVLLGGVETISGPLVGAMVYKALSVWLLSTTDMSKLILGLLIVLLVAAFPMGIVGWLSSMRERIRHVS